MVFEHHLYDCKYYHIYKEQKENNYIDSNLKIKRILKKIRLH